MPACRKKKAKAKAKAAKAAKAAGAASVPARKPPPPPKDSAVPPDELTVHGTERMDKDTPRSFLDLPVQVLDDGNVSVVLADPATSDDGSVSVALSDPAMSDDRSVIAVLTDDPATFEGGGLPSVVTGHDASWGKDAGLDDSGGGCGGDGDGDTSGEGWKNAALRARFGSISEHTDPHYDADRIGWQQGRPIPNSSIGGNELVNRVRFLSSTGPRRMSKTRKGTVIGCGVPSLDLPLCTRRRAAATSADSGFPEEGDDDDDDKKFTTDAQRSLALRAVYARHRHDLTLTELQKIVTELGGDLVSRRMLTTTISLMEHEETKAARSIHAADKPTITDFDDGACEDFTVGVATELGAPRDGVRVAADEGGEEEEEEEEADDDDEPPFVMFHALGGRPVGAEAADDRASMAEARDDEGVGHADESGDEEEAEEGEAEDEVTRAQLRLSAMRAATRLQLEAEDEELSARRAQLSALRAATRLQLSHEPLTRRVTHQEARALANHRRTAQEKLNERVRTCEKKHERREQRCGRTALRFPTRSRRDRQPQLLPQQQRMCSGIRSACVRRTRGVTHNVLFPIRGLLLLSLLAAALAIPFRFAFVRPRFSLSASGRRSTRSSRRRARPPGALPIMQLWGRRAA